MKTVSPLSARSPATFDGSSGRGNRDHLRSEAIRLAHNLEHVEQRTSLRQISPIRDNSLEHCHFGGAPVVTGFASGVAVAVRSVLVSAVGSCAPARVVPMAFSANVDAAVIPNPPR